jgi:hypothetical protein
VDKIVEMIDEKDRDLMARMQAKLDALQAKLDKLAKNAKTNNHQKTFAEAIALQNKKPEADEDQKATKLLIKRVEVDPVTHEFGEETEYIGRVRKYVRSLKNHQENMKAGLAFPKDISLQGYATGSNFYPHNGISSTGVPTNNNTLYPRDSPSHLKVSKLKVGMTEAKESHRAPST